MPTMVSSIATTAAKTGRRTERSEITMAAGALALRLAVLRAGEPHLGAVGDLDHAFGHDRLARGQARQYLDHAVLVEPGAHRDALRRALVDDIDEALVALTHHGDLGHRERRPRLRLDGRGQQHARHQ